jgi:hypothetical protein
MSLTSTQKAQLTKMNRAAQNVELGTLIGNMAANSVVTGSALVVTTPQMSASAVVIATGRTGVIGSIINWTRSGSHMGPVKVVNSGSNLTVTSACATWAFTAGDTVAWVCF